MPANRLRTHGRMQPSTEPGWRGCAGTGKSHPTDGSYRVTPATASSLGASISTAIPRAALVTGGGRRLGRAIALALAQAGFDVAVHCNASREDAEATCREIVRLGRRG